MKLITAFLVAAAALGCATCTQDPKRANLRKGVDLMTSIVRSRVLVDAVRSVDPHMRASTAAGAALSGGVTANFKQPPEDIAIANEGKPTQTWCVVLTGDDKKKEVIIEGFGEELDKPLIVQRLPFPPK